MQTYEQHLSAIMDELHDLHEDAENYADDLTWNSAIYRSARGVQHKVEEALGKLNSALDAASQGGL